MIVAMKKAAVIVQSKDAAATVEKLRSLGVLHVQHQQPPKANKVSELQDDIGLIKEACGILFQAEFFNKRASTEEKELRDWRFTARHIIDSYKRIEHLEEYSRILVHQIAEWEPWGDFDPDEVNLLAQKGVFIRLYKIPVRDIKKFPAEVLVKKAAIIGGFAYCMAVSEEKITIPFKEFTLPKMGLFKMRARIEEDRQIVEKIKEQIRSSCCYLGSFRAVRESLEKDLEFQEALSGMGKAAEIVYLTGFIPFDAAAPLLKISKEEKWGVLINDPAQEDDVPTLIRNPRWVSIINPVFRALEIIPGYHELDISLLFLLFLSIFFGMLIGDAGYGAIFFMLTFFAQRRFSKKVGSNSIFILLYIFSFFAVIWGVLTGTFFGQEWLPHSVKPIVPALRDSRQLQELCFLLGALHLSIAHLWRTVIKLPSLIALADVGWIMILWGAFFLARTLILEADFPVFGKWLFAAGSGLVVFFTSLNRNPLKGIGNGLGNLLLNIVNSFTDVVSYIRLFAVGLATVAVADAFNKMALGVGFANAPAALLSALILFVGHTLNILLGPMSVLVHGVRLNVLEFCNHIDLKWSGFAYRPLKE